MELVWILLLLFCFYAVIAGIVTVVSMGEPRDPPLMLILLFLSGCVVLPAMLIMRVLR